MQAFLKFRISHFIIPIYICLVFNDAFCVSKKAAENNELGVKALNEGNYRYAIECLRSALIDAPDNEIIKKNLSNAYNNYGLSLLKKGETLNAIDNFEQSTKYNPLNAYAFLDLAQCYYALNNIEKTKVYLDQAYKIKPDISGLDEFLAKVRRESDVESGLKKIDTMHFVIVSDKDLNIDNLANVRISLDEAYSRIGAFLDYFPKQKTVVIIYPEHVYRDLVKGHPSWTHASFDGKIRIPLQGKSYSRDYLMKTIYHEYAHAVVREIAGKNSPMWLNESIACFAEGFVESKDRSFFSQYISAENFVPFNRLPYDYGNIRSDWDANLLYREFYLLASFIVERYGSSSLRGILSSLGAGKDIGQAMRISLSIGIDEFSRSWQNYVFKKLSL